MKLPHVISQQKNMLAVMAGVLLVLWLTQPYLSKWMGLDTPPKPLEASNANKTLHPEPNTSASPGPATPDPFKDFIDQKGSNAKPADIAATTATSKLPSITPGHQNSQVDPFKAHLDLQKKQLESASVSPFGK
jgi:hypothetical protein